MESARKELPQQRGPKKKARGHFSAHPWLAYFFKQGGEAPRSHDDYRQLQDYWKERLFHI